MKHNLLRSTLVVLLMAFLGAGFYACEEDDQNEKENIVTDEEALEITEDQINSTADGLNTQIKMASTFAFIAQMEAAFNKSATVENTTAADTSFSWEFSGPNVSYNYTVSISYGLGLSGTTPVFNFSYSAEGNYEGPSISKDGSHSSSFVVTGLGESSDVYIMNGETTYEGNLTLKNFENKSYSSTSDFTLVDVTVNKLTGVVQSGTVTFTISGTNGEGESYSFAGSLEYQGDDTAILTIGDEEYEIDLSYPSLDDFEE